MWQGHHQLEKLKRQIKFDSKYFLIQDQLIFKIIFLNRFACLSMSMFLLVFDSYRPFC